MSQKLSEVLLVDDYEADNYLHRLAFETLGCAEKVSVAKNGEEALAHLARSTPELICLDINMPVMDGWEFIRAFEALEPRPPSLLLVMLTTSSRAEDRQRAKAQPLVADYVEKPLTAEVLGQRLAQWFPGRFPGLER